VQPESGNTTYTYYADGQLKRKTDAEGLWVEMEYDGIGDNLVCTLQNPQ